MDELGKMASELVQMLEEAEQSAGSPAFMRQLDRVVALIREARAEKPSPTREHYHSWR